MSVPKINKLSRILLFLSLLLLAIGIRVFLFYIITTDMTYFEAIWYDRFIEYGRIDAFKEIFYNYQPPLLYLIDIASLFRFIPKEIAIKLISVLFDIFTAFGIYKIVELKFPQTSHKWIGFFAALLLPTVFIESSMWGQSDIIYSCFLVWALFFILKKKHFLALFAFSIALTFKLQAIFFAPILALLLFRRKIPFWLFFIVPVVYFVSVVPAWLAGGPLDKLLTMYITQFNTYHSLSMRAPNLYMFINPGDSFNLIVQIGMAFTFLLILLFIVFRILKYKDLSSESLCLDAALITILIPFCLPKMHDRYFFAGCLFLLILALINNRFIWAAILCQASSIISYIPYFTGWSDVFAKIGAVINVFLVVGLLIYYFEYHKGFEYSHPKIVETGTQ